MPNSEAKRFKETNWTLPENIFYHSAREVAQFLGISRMQLYRWIELHPFPKAFYKSDYIHLCYRTICVNQIQVVKWAKGLLEKGRNSMNDKTLQGLHRL